MTTTDDAATTEPVVNQHGQTIAILQWRDNGDGTKYARIDDGTLTRRSDGTVTARCQDDAGTVRDYEMPDVATAFYTLGLSTHRRNGINLWRELDNLPGLAGRD